MVVAVTLAVAITVVAIAAPVGVAVAIVTVSIGVAITVSTSVTVAVAVAVAVSTAAPRSGSGRRRGSCRRRANDPAESSLRGLHREAGRRLGAKDSRDSRRVLLGFTATSVLVCLDREREILLVGFNLVKHVINGQEGFDRLRGKCGRLHINLLDSKAA